MTDEVRVTAAPVDGASADCSPGAIAGRERKRAPIDGRRMIATAAVSAVFSIAVFAAGGVMLNALFSADEAPTAAVPAATGQLYVGVGARVCNSEALFEQSIDAALANPDAPLITGCWRAGAPMPAVVLASGARASLVLVEIEGIGQMWMQRDALQRSQQG